MLLLLFLACSMLVFTACARPLLPDRRTGTCSVSVFFVILFLYHLEQEKLQIIGLFHAPEDGVVLGLLAGFDLL